MVLRGRKGWLVYLLFGLAVIVAVYYMWSTFFMSQPQLYSNMEEMQPRQEEGWNKARKDFAVIEHPPVGLNNEIQVQMDSEQWRKDKALQDQIDEETVAREMANKLSVNSDTKDSIASPWKTYKEKPSGIEAALFRIAETGEREYFEQLERLVHLDLKGAPPYPSYLIGLFPALKTLGATGLLIEYEDMFPYSGNLSILSAANAYSSSDIQRILAAAKENGLQVIPLVQMFGHMEFVLKFDRFRELRESEYTPQVITPVSEKSYQLLYEILEQIIRAHPDSTRIHLGCDEVGEIGQGKSADLMASQRRSRGQVYLEHVFRVATYVKSRYPGLQPLIWDDIMRNIPYDMLASSHIRNVIEPVVWFYQHNILDRITPDVWDIYGKLFPGVWVASAFKGATGSAKMLTNASYHLDNNLQWMSVMQSLGYQGNKVKFRGTMLTGWQRYDHFAVLCELLPVGLPSLALNLQLLRTGGFSHKEVTTASKALNCSGSSTLDLEFPLIRKDEAVISQSCKFSGYEVYYGVQHLWGIMEVFQRDKSLQDSISGWLTPFQVRQGISSPGRMKPLLHKLGKILNGLRNLIQPMQTALQSVYDKNTVEEWINTNIKSHIYQIKDLYDKAKYLLQRKEWPARPFPAALPQVETRQEQSGTIRKPVQTGGVFQQNGIGQQQEYPSIGGQPSFGKAQQNLPHVQQSYDGQLNLGRGQQPISGSVQGPQSVNRRPPADMEGGDVLKSQGNFGSQGKVIGSSGGQGGQQMANSFGSQGARKGALSQVLVPGGPSGPVKSPYDLSLNTPAPGRIDAGAGSQINPVFRPNMQRLPGQSLVRGSQPGFGREQRLEQLGNQKNLVNFGQKDPGQNIEGPITYPATQQQLQEPRGLSQRSRESRQGRLSFQNQPEINNAQQGGEVPLPPKESQKGNEAGNQKEREDQNHRVGEKNNPPELHDKPPDRVRQVSPSPFHVGAPDKSRDTGNVPIIADDPYAAEHTKNDKQIKVGEKKEVEGVNEGEKGEGDEEEERDAEGGDDLEDLDPFDGKRKNDSPSLQG